MLVFLAYPLGGILGALVVSSAGSAVGAAVAAGVIATAQGAVLGMLMTPRTAVAWVGGSAVAGGLGWAVSHAVVPSDAGLASAALTAGISGLAIGGAQALGPWGSVLGAGGGLPARAAWALLFGVAWAAGNTVSTAIGVDTAAWPVFGAAGAITAQAILLVGIVVAARRDLPAANPGGIA
jgi:hypothetical protein